jgi:hypothetical protein
MNVKYLFDTSAVRGSSKKVIANLYDKVVLYVSSESFWEILTHLEEDFGFYRNELLKLRFFKILDDPHAYLDKIFLPNNFRLKNRSPDYDIIYKMIWNLWNSKSIDTFYSTKITDSKGYLRETKDCVPRAQDSLLNFKEEYVRFVGKIIDGLKKGLIEFPNHIEDYHERIMELIEGQVIKYRQRDPLVKNLRKRVISRFYIYFSYILHRALKYYESNTDIKNIDKNDYVDSSICLHLRLQTSYRLVAEDKRLREALVKTISSLKSLNNSKFKTALTVKRLNDLRTIQRVI